MMLGYYCIITWKNSLFWSKFLAFQLCVCYLAAVFTPGLIGELARHIYVHVNKLKQYTRHNSQFLHLCHFHIHRLIAPLLTLDWPVSLPRVRRTERSEDRRLSRVIPGEPLISHKLDTAWQGRLCSLYLHVCLFQQYGNDSNSKLRSLLPETAL